MIPSEKDMFEHLILILTRNLAHKMSRMKMRTYCNFDIEIIGLLTW